MQGGFPRANAVRYVADKYGVNHLGCICALDRATLPTLHAVLGAGNGGHRHHRAGGQCPDLPG